MSDLPYIQQAQEVKITGQGTTGATVNYVGADSSGNMTTRDAADGIDGATAPTFTMQVGGKDTNGNLQTIFTDISGNLSVKTLDLNGSGTLTALNTTVVATLNGYSTIIFDLTGTWVGTVLFQGQNGDSIWSTIIGTVTGQGIAAAALTSNGSIAIPCGGFTQVRALMSTYVSGTVDVQYNASIGAQSTQIFNLQPTSLVGIMNIKDTSGNTITALNNQVQTRDVINTSSQYRAQSVTTSAAEALGAATILVNRKLITITPTNGTIYWGTNSSVTTTTGTPIFANQTLALSFTDNIHVFVIAAATTDARIVEGS